MSEDDAWKVMSGLDFIKGPDCMERKAREQGDKIAEIQ